MQLVRNKLLTVALSLLNGVLALMLWLQMGVAPGAAISDAQPAISVAQPAPPPPRELPRLPPFSAYQELTERPLFWSERRAVHDAVAAAPDGTPATMSFTLLGVIQADAAHALLGRNGAKEVARVRVGDVVEGWVIEAITADTVTLVANGARHELRVGTSRSNTKPTSPP